MDNQWITADLVKAVMDNLPNKRCTGFDRIPVIFYKDGIDLLLPIITNLMQEVIQTKVISEQWKVTKVVPIIKKGDSKSVENYRPSSNLCSITKIFEKIIHTRKVESD